MLPPPELVSFTTAFASYQRRVGAAIHELFRLDLPPEPPPSDRRRWLSASARPRVHAMREAIERRHDRSARASLVSAFSGELQQLIAEQPQTLELREGSVSVEVPLQRYLTIEFWPRLEPSFAELEQSLERALGELDRRVLETERTVDYYLLAVKRHAIECEDAEAEELACTGAERVERLIAELQQRAASWAHRTRAEFTANGANALADACAPYRAHRPEVVLRRITDHEQAQSSDARRSLLGEAATRVERQVGTLAPLARQLHEELRVALAPSHDQAFEADAPALEPAALGVELPLGYRRLFTGVPPNVDLFVARPDLERRFADAIARWETGLPQQILVHGDRGSGKRTLANRVLASACSEARCEIHWMRLDPRLREEPIVAAQLARALGYDHATSFAELAPDGLAVSHPRRAVVVENAERLLAPSSMGIARMSAFLALVGRTAASTLWVLLMATPAARMVLHRLGFGDRIPTVLEIPGMDPAELQQLISMRHRLSGFEIEYRPPSRSLLERLTHLRPPPAQEAFYQRLFEITDGNPRQALYAWLGQVHPDPRRASRILVDALDPPPLRVSSLPIDQRLVLALLAQHGSLTKEELIDALAVPSDEVAGAIAALRAKAMLVPNPEHHGHWTLPPTQAHPIVLELRSANMI